MNSPVSRASGAPSQGWSARDEQSDHLTLALDDEEGNTMQQLQGHSITHWIAMEANGGVKCSPCKRFEAWGEDDNGTDQLGRNGGFSLHGGGLPSNSRYREHITPTRSVKVKKTTTDEEADGREESDQTAGKRKRMYYTLKGIKAQRLKRVFIRVA